MTIPILATAVIAIMLAAILLGCLYYLRQRKTRTIRSLEPDILNAVSEFQTHLSSGLYFNRQKYEEWKDHHDHLKDHLGMWSPQRA